MSKESQPRKGQKTKPCCQIAQDFLIPEWVAWELENWATWCFSGGPVGPVIPKRTRSLESRYASGPDWEGPLVTPPPEPNRGRAEQVHKVYLGQLTLEERRALVLRYIKRFPWRRIPRLMRISETKYLSLVSSTVRRIEQAFARGSL